MRRPLHRSVLVVGLLSGTAAAQQGAGAVPLLGADIRPAGITFRVASGGCTRKANFGVETLAQNPLTLRLVRLTPDYCEARVPDGAAVTFTFAELGQSPKLTDAALQSIVIVNSRLGP